ncbi:hypothetical protein G4W71_09060 [Clostridium botulinum]|uniref:hypothetical protein n=1 Tax=Clostridium botulinum TaxID=1491 RepID=UPI001788C790|nr:hypothetical protein [Clostridium botulinum]MBE1304167.1 hypothetical protein [Clostridium botulinum]
MLWNRIYGRWLGLQECNGTGQGPILWSQEFVFGVIDGIAYLNTIALIQKQGWIY